MVISRFRRSQTGCSLTNVLTAVNTVISGSPRNWKCYRTVNFRRNSVFVMKCTYDGIFLEIQKNLCNPQDWNLRIIREIGWGVKIAETLFHLRHFIPIIRKDYFPRTIVQFRVQPRVILTLTVIRLGTNSKKKSKNSRNKISKNKIWLNQIS